MTSAEHAESAAAVAHGQAVVEGDERSRQILGAAFDGAATFARMLAAEGELRGLIGPRELPRLWRRHVVNSAAVASFLPTSGSLVDVGSGAGLPGIVLALMRPDLQVHLVEPMQRRVAWLTKVRDHLELVNVEVHCSRAEDLLESLRADAVTARAVANLDKLAGWTMPMVRLGGLLLAMKGQRAAAEAKAADGVLRRLGASMVTVHDVDLYDDGDVTRIVEIRK